jgi:hypothetical protein
MTNPLDISYHPTQETLLFEAVSIPREALKRVLPLYCGPCNMQVMSPEAKLHLISKWSTQTILVHCDKEWAVLQ